MATWYPGKDKDGNGGVDINIDTGGQWSWKIWKKQVDLAKYKDFIANKLNTFFKGDGGAIIMGVGGFIITALAFSILFASFRHGIIMFSVPLILMFISGPFAIVLCFRWDRLS